MFHFGSVSILGLRLRISRFAPPPYDGFALIGGMLVL